MKAVDKSETMSDEIIDTTVVVKPKPNEDMRVRVVRNGFKQKPGEQFKEDNLSVPVISLISHRIVRLLICMCNWHNHLIDVEGAFLDAIFDNDERIFVRVPEKF